MNRYYVMRAVKEPYRLIEVYRDETAVMLQKHRDCGRIVPDYMQKPFPLISDRVKQLFERFIGEGIYTPCVLQEEPETVFWEFHPKKVEPDFAVFALNGEVEAIHDFGLEPFLEVDGFKKKTILISRMAAESLLRRGYNILELAAVETLA